MDWAFLISLYTNFIIKFEIEERHVQLGHKQQLNFLHFRKTFPICMVVSTETMQPVLSIWQIF